MIAVRGDVIDRCADHPELVDALQEGPFVLGAMNEQELRAAVTVPAAAAGLRDLRPTYELRRHLDETACLVTGGGLDRERWPRYLPDLPYRDTCG